jgi:hypothetical protein
VKALTIHQPWASFIAWGEKRIETRDWYTPYRGQLAIHAGKYHPDRSYDLWIEPNKSILAAHDVDGINQLPWGAVIATCQLVKCIRMTPTFVAIMNDGNLGMPHEYELGLYEPGRFAWVLADVQRVMPPVSTRGYPGLWEWEDPANGRAA